MKHAYEYKHLKKIKQVNENKNNSFFAGQSLYIVTLLKLVLIIYQQGIWLL